jgi:hypothetical protein
MQPQQQTAPYAKPLLARIVRHWLPLAAITTVLCGTIYAAGQQVLRLSGNDPQIQMAQDAASRLAAGEAVAIVLPPATIDLGRSLAPFMIVFDDQGAVLGASGQLHGQPPGLPPGVLDYVRQHGEDRISFQPEPGARFATIVERVTGTRPGFVLVGRSLRETEQREQAVEQLAGAGWLAALVLSLIVVALAELALGGARRSASP